MTSLPNVLAHAVLIAAVASAGLPANAAPEKTVCTVRNAAAAVREIIPANVPPFAEAAHLSGSALVQFDLDARGVARNAAIVGSTGNSLLDGAAREAALEQGYSPEVRDCDAVAGTYRIIVDFPSSR